MKIYRNLCFMAKILAGIIVGSAVTLVALTLFTGLFYGPAERELINSWRQIRLGMPRAEVERILGTPSYDFKTAAGFPEWATKSVPNDFHLNHGLLVFTTKGMGPQLLLVYVDENGRVEFVSSTPT